MLKDIQAQGVTQNTSIFNTTIDGLCKMGKMSEAEVRALQSNGIPESAGSDVLKSASESIIDLAAIFAMLFGGELHVLHVKRFKFAPSQGSATAETNPSEPLLSALEVSIDGRSDVAIYACFLL
ncbi:hypothetical protein ACFE04_015823 [Oxalis oulophora]